MCIYKYLPFVLFYLIHDFFVVALFAYNILFCLHVKLSSVDMCD